MKIVSSLCLEGYKIILYAFVFKVLKNWQSMSFFNRQGYDFRTSQNTGTCFLKI